MPDIEGGLRDLLTITLDMSPSQPSHVKATEESAKLFCAMQYQDKKTGSAKADLEHFYEDVVAPEVDDHLKTLATEGLYFAVFVKDGDVEATALTGDIFIIHLDTVDPTKTVICPLALYYVFDIDYPKPYSMALGSLQQRVLGDLFLGLKQFSSKGIPKLKKTQGYGNIMALLDAKSSTV